MGLKVAVVGLAPSTHDLAPWGDANWEVWALPWDKRGWCKADRLFDMHDVAHLKTFMDADYFERLRSLDVPLYMPSESEEVPNATVFPIDAAIEIAGDYFSSTIAYMVALAIHEQAEEIALYGVDMAASSEYSHQRPNLEYILGIAKGRGIKVTIPWQSPVCKYDRIENYLTRYGYGDNKLQ